MSLILDRDEPEPPIARTERDNLIQFPPELFGIVRTPWRTWAAAEISSSSARARAVAEGRSKRIEALVTSDAPSAPAASAIDLVRSTGDVPTRPGQGWINWPLFGQVLMLRQMEIEVEPLVEINREWARVVEARVRQELYG